MKGLRYFYEQAFKRELFLQKCNDLSSQITKHLIKILLYPNNTESKHWKIEVIGWIDSLREIKLKNGLKKKVSSVKIALIDDSPWYDEINNDFSTGLKRSIYRRIILEYGEPENPLMMKR
jgi:hypothetical protein